MKSTFYYGIFEFNSETYQGSHEPLISKKLFDKCQEVMKDRGHIMTRKSENFFPFRGLLTCGECKCMITAETQKGHNYYRCTKKREVCSQKYVREEVLTEQIKSFLQKVSLSSQDTEKVLRELDKDEQKAREESKVFVENLKNELADVEARLDKLLSAYLDEVITSEEYAAQKQKMLDQRVELKEKISEIENKGVSWLEPAHAWVKSLNQAEKLLESGDKTEMTTFLKQIGSNHILIDKSLSFSPKKPFQILCERRVSRRELASSNLHFPNWRWRFPEL
ncbi:MAG: recombinase zinc beta ribbon domain-containing protein [Candidatus Sungbacteria bacterium]|nr:recombinase zinc beta ribbon domain-containing protein [Candidatus Sungbacteria bacterium]